MNDSVHKKSITTAEYVEKIKSLRDEGRFAEAECIAEEVLSSNPGNFKIAYQLARIADDKRDWRLSGARWRYLVDHFPERIRARDFAKVATFLRKNGLISESSWYIKEGMRRDPEDVKILFEYGRHCQLKGEPEAAKDAYSKIIKLTEDQGIRSHLHKIALAKMTSLLSESGHAEDVRSIVQNLALNEAIVTDKHIEDMLTGSEKAIEEVRDILSSQEQELPSGIMNNWLVTFNRIVASLGVMNASDEANWPQSDVGRSVGLGPLESTSAYPSILGISGMGYSGSGALIDFFSEFDEVQLLESQFRPFSGRFGMNRLPFFASNKVDFHRAIFHLLFRELLGCKKPTGISDMSLQLKRQRISRSSEYGFKISIAAHNYFTRIIEHYWNGDIIENFPKLNANFFWEVGSGREGGIVLQDQLVKLTGNPLAHVNLMEPAKFFFVFRDPRSNFANLKRREEPIADDVDSFINWYRGVRERYEFDLKAEITDKSKVNTVQYEHFILHEEYRNKLAVTAGLDINRKRENRVFFPDVSVKKVYEYRDFGDSSAIERIRAELPEYIVDI